MARLLRRIRFKLKNKDGCNVLGMFIHTHTLASKFHWIRFGACACADAHHYDTQVFERIQLQ